MPRRHPSPARPGQRRVDRQVAHRRHRRVEANVRASRDILRLADVELSAGAVIDALIYFTDRPDEAKKRPVIVIGVRDRQLLVLKCTTDLRPRFGYSRLLDWQAAGLAHPSNVALAAVAIDRTQVRQLRGRVTDDDLTRLAELRSALS